MRHRGFEAGPIIGDSPAIREARRLIELYAPSGLSILIVGATGTGKELLARHIHRLSGRGGPWVPVNCAALPALMAESMLFGHRRGAFSGAVESRLGYIRSAHRGNLFLDELLDLPAEVQPKLLRALDLGEVQPLGEDVPAYVDLRVTAAVQDDLPVRLEAGGFRHDLSQRIAGIVIWLPPLAARPEDLLSLANHFAALGCRVLGPGVERVLLNYAWPGNVRELQMAIERAGHLVENGMLSAGALAESIELGAVQSKGVNPLRSADASLAARTRLLAVCEANGWDVRRIAVALGRHRSTVYRLLKQHRLLRPLDWPRTFDSEPGGLSGSPHSGPQPPKHGAGADPTAARGAPDRAPRREDLRVAGSTD